MLYFSPKMHQFIIEFPNNKQNIPTLNRMHYTFFTLSPFWNSSCLRPMKSKTSSDEAEQIDIDVNGIVSNHRSAIWNLSGRSSTNFNDSDS